MLRAIFNRIRNRLQVYNNYRAIARQIPFLKNTSNIPAGTKVAIVDFTSRRLERHYYFIIKFLSDSGYHVLLINNKISLGCWFMFGRQLTDIPNLHLIDELPAMQSGWLYFTDTNNHEKIDAGKRIQVRIDVANADMNAANTVMMPLPMSVELYASDAHKRLKAYRENRKVAKIVYSGNLDDAYNNESLKRIYHKNTRLEIINEVRNLNDNELLIFNDVMEYQRLTQQGFINKFVLFDWFWNGGSSNLKGRIDSNDWLTILSQSDFFLGCPGIVMPPTHAVVEAMAVGTIPILQWPEFFTPFLKDSVNCIVFNDLKELTQRIKDILSAPQANIERLRENVITYYEEHLSPSAYIRKVETCNERYIQYYLYTDYSHY